MHTQTGKCDARAPMFNEHGKEKVSDSLGRWRSKGKAWQTIVGKGWQDGEETVHFVHKRIRDAKGNRGFEDFALNQLMHPMMDGNDGG